MVQHGQRSFFLLLDIWGLPSVFLHLNSKVWLFVATTIYVFVYVLKIDLRGKITNSEEITGRKKKFNNLCHVMPITLAHSEPTAMPGA